VTQLRKCVKCGEDRTIPGRYRYDLPGHFEAWVCEVCEPLPKPKSWQEILREVVAESEQDGQPHVHSEHYSPIMPNRFRWIGRERTRKESDAYLAECVRGSSDPFGVVLLPRVDFDRLLRLAEKAASAAEATP
jgi:hypothetical protein